MDGHGRNLSTRIERPGLVGEANESTLFLDEIAELPRASQAHLLRVLDKGEYHRLGEGVARASNFRLIVATNRDPSVLKHDLLARLTFRVAAPDLDQRREDIVLLARHLLRAAVQKGDDMARALFPGGDGGGEPALGFRLVRDLVARSYDTNVRELEAAIWRSFSAPATSGDLAAGAVARSTPPPPSRDPDGPACSFCKPPVAEADHSSERERIQKCLDEHNGVLELAWRALGMKNRFMLTRAIKRYGLEVRKRHTSALPPK
jgi:transcriptional regulator with GAF, ATPase, and Fis domain